MPDSDRQPSPDVVVPQHAFVPGDIVRVKSKVVCWFRRFASVPTADEVELRRLLENAADQFTTMITLQDASVRSRFQAMRLGKRHLLLVIAAWAIALWLWSMMFPPHSGDYLFYFIVIGVVGLLMLPLIVLPLIIDRIRSRILARRSGFVDLGLDPIVACARFIDEHRYTGLTILRCHETDWQDVVQICLSRSDAVVIDVTELSSNLIWELKQTLAYHSLEKILFTFATEFHSPVSSAPAPLAELVMQVLGSGFRDRIRFFAYPRRGPVVTDELTQELRGALMSCLGRAYLNCPYCSNDLKDMSYCPKCDLDLREQEIGKDRDPQEDE